jgi:hypothetical protein
MGTVGYSLTVSLFVPVKHEDAFLPRFSLVITHFFLRNWQIVLLGVLGHRGCICLSVEETLSQGTFDHDDHAPDRNNSDDPRARLCVISNLEFLMALTSSPVA